MPATVFVRALDPVGNRGATTLVLVAADRTDSAPPSSPSDLDGSATGTTVTLSWTAANGRVGVTGYVVQRDGTDLGAGRRRRRRHSRIARRSGQLPGVIAVDAAGNRSVASVAVAGDRGRGARPRRPPTR